MFRLSNLVTALFGIIAALGAILGVTSLGSMNRTATEPGESPASSLNAGDGVASLTDPNGADLSAPRQVGQNAASPGTPIVTGDGATAPQNPTESVFPQGEGAVLSNQPAPPTTPSEAVAVQLDPSPGVAPATVPTPPAPAPVAQASEAATTPASAPAAPASSPVRAMW